MADNKRLNALLDMFYFTENKREADLLLKAAERCISDDEDKVINELHAKQSDSAGHNNSGSGVYIEKKKGIASRVWGHMFS